jgi:hypothetical protein
VARERKAAQEAWNALAVKVPAHAPWAPNGYQRLMKRLDAAQEVQEGLGTLYYQPDARLAATALNAAINSMRPGNLAELEDLRELRNEYDRASRRLPSPDKELNDAVEHAAMVVSYVEDGSGTHDMIAEAIKRLKAALN